MKPSTLLTFLFAVFAAQATACAVQNDLCGAGKASDKVCGCIAPGNLLQCQQRRRGLYKWTLYKKDCGCDAGKCTK